MLRYFYLIILFICINTTLLDARSNGNINSHKRRRDVRVKKSSGNNKEGSEPRYENDYKSPVQQFDVASFVQVSDETLDEEPYDFTINTGGSSNNFDYESGVSNEDNKKEEKAQDYLNMGFDNTADFKFNPALYKDVINPKYMDINGISTDDANTVKRRRNKIRKTYKDYLLDQFKNHNPAKKCAVKNMKFPFFSHNKSTVKPKKNKKRKFCLNCPKTAKKANGEILKRVEVEPNITIKVKRVSGDDNGCSPRKKKHRRIEDTDRQKKSSIIHNSRQFFQNTENLENMERKAKQFTDNASKSVGKMREKRQEMDRERQLKELEEVRKKIDSVEIHMPTFEKKHPETFE